MKQRFNLYQVQNSELKDLKAGQRCGCSCWAADSGGSSHWNNGMKNLETGYWSIKGVCTLFVSSEAHYL